MTKRAAFRQADLSRALKVATLAGLTVQRFEVEPDGKIVVVTGEAEKPDTTLSAVEAWQAKRAREQAAQEAKERAEIRAGTARAFGRPARRRGRHDPAPEPVTRP